MSAARNARRAYTRDSIERGLDSHAAARRIRGWDRTGDGRYRIGLNANNDLYLRSLRDVHLLLAGLASAGYAPTAAATQESAA